MSDEKMRLISLLALAWLRHPEMSLGELIVSLDRWTGYDLHDLAIVPDKDILEALERADEAVA